MDNNLDKIFEKCQALKNRGATIEPVQPVKQASPEKKVEAPIKEQKEEKENEKEKEEEKEKAEGGWTQELQKLLEAIVAFKDIEDPKEKWEKIA